MRFYPFILVMILLPCFSKAQIGGGQGYQVLNLSTNARAAALGGTTISLADGDISQFFQNPATLDSVVAGNIFFNINPYFAETIVFTGAYSFDVKKLGNISLGLHYLDFGMFERTDAAGNSIGEFDAQDYVFTIGKAHQLGPITMGINAKLAHSSIDEFGSTAILGDIGGLFRINKSWTMAMVFSNIGGRLTNYNDLNTTPVPLDVKLGTTFKPEYMPLRFTLTSANLAQENVVKASSETGRSNEGIEKVLRRINVGAELLLSKNLNLLFGYNHKKKQELKLDERTGGAGFSYGIMLNIKRIQLRYSRATFHAAGGSSFISLQTNLNDFKRIL